MSTPALRIVLHASDPPSLQRARNNARNALREPGVEVRVIVNGGEAVSTLLDQPDAVVDALTWPCPNTLRGLERSAPPPLHVLEEGAVLALARLQQAGWCYVHA